MVLSFAAAAGLSIVAFTAACNWAERFFNGYANRMPWLTVLWIPAATAGIVWVTRRWFPGAASSGIPQVMVALDVRPEDRPLFVSLRLSAAKLVLTAAGLLAGHSIGREGPSVQVAAGVMYAARRWLSPQTLLSENSLLIAGGAAGIAAAFNAPLAGIVFAIEELARRFEARASGLVIAAIVLAGLMGASIFGNESFFGRLAVAPLDWGILVPGLAVTLICGLAGGLFSRLIASSNAGLPDRVSAYRQRHPVAFAACCGLAIAITGLASGGSSFGGGFEAIRQMLAGHLEDTIPGVFTLLKFVATWLSAWSGVPGGIFAPSLAVGAGIGHDVAQIAGLDTHMTALVALGMAAFLAAVTQAPITAFIIVMEMVDGHAMVLSLMTSAALAALVSRGVSQPLYDMLAELQFRRVPVDPERAHSNLSTPR